MRTCTICHHPERAAIEAALVAGTSYRHIASQFSVGYKSIERHATDHVKQAIKQSQTAKEEAQALDVIRQLKTINSVTLHVLEEVRKAKEHMTTLYAVDRVMKQLELQAKLLGDLDDRPQVNITLTPEWQAIRAAIVQALAPYPAARVAVASALVHLEGTRDLLN
jgi:transposase